MANTDKTWQDSFHGWLTSQSMRNRETILTLLICLFISAVLWLFNALNKNYTTTIKHHVEYVNLPKNKFIINNPPELLNLRVNGSGFKLLRYKMTTSFSPLLLNVTDILNENSGSSAGLNIISSKNIADHIEVQLGDEIELLRITPEIFTLAFDSLDVRRVPVVSNVRFVFKPRFGLTIPPAFNPSHVNITGPHELIRKTDSVYTVQRMYRNIDASFSEEIPLIIPRQIFVEPGRVIMKATVDEFTERSMSLPVWIENQPDNYSVRLFPHEVEVSFKISLTDYTQVKPEDFSLFVSWEEISRNTPLLKVGVKKSPSCAGNLKINPENVEYLIERN